MANRNVKFETIKSEVKEFGHNNFLEVSRNKAISSRGENEYIQISRGYYRMNFETEDSDKVYRKTVTVPDIDEVKKFIKEKIEEV